MAARDAQEYILQRIEVDSITGCWKWRLSLNHDGYGRANYKHRQMLAHRTSYEAFVGEVPAGQELDHLCRTRECVNPDHLEAVSHYVNIMRGKCFSSLNAKKTHCHAGHPLSGSNVYTTRNGGRVCRTCSNAASIRYTRSGARERTRARSALAKENVA
jgi:hypothetical protein